MRLRLFPLAQVVLFPGQTLALRVFERRYRQLVAECVQAEEPFGVVLIKDGVEVGGSAIPHEMGTTARITGATGNLDGTLNVQVRGEQRFHITALYDTAPYLMADAETVLDEFAEVNSEVLRFARSGLVRTRELQAIATGEFERAPKVAQTPGAVADAIAGQAPAEAEQLQAILETTNVRERLDSVLPMLESVVAVARTSASRAISSRWAGPGMSN
jgi:Lon protease-like protein